VKSADLQEWTKEELVEAVMDLRKENASLQKAISRFLSGNTKLLNSEDE